MELLNKIQIATNENSIKQIMNSMLKDFFGIYNKDYKGELLKISNKNDFLLTEFKLREDFSKPLERAKVILKAIFYMKKLELEGNILPSVLLVADCDEAFILHTNHLNKYLSLDLDWKQSYKNFPDIMLEIAKDEKLNSKIWVDKLDSEGKIRNLCFVIEKATEIQRKVRIHPFNIHVIFEDFRDRVLKNWKEIGANKAVGIFMSCLLDTENNDLSRRNKDIFMWWNPLTKQDTRVSVNGDLFDAFWNYFDREEYSIKEKKLLISISDEIIEETNRRIKGEYYTPNLWVKEAHNEITKIFGENWKQEYVVWDCACGTGNLTRDYDFKELYISTLNESDLIQAGYRNENAIKFQFDFLNDEDSKLPKGLRDALKTKKVIFLINPPYAQSANVGRGTTETKIKELAINEGMKNGVKDLYAQFIFRICKYHEKNPNINLAIFSKATYLAGTSFKPFRKKLLNEFDYQYGMLFNASEFSDVSSAWGILFSIWKGRY
ncbi:MAG: Eco57I restriction-modification methylase domain-containing protein [Clostridia bacterium]|nr:Eco57I restriction-modification methylase domain-containing protein [Clostridia bacterium]